MTDATTTPSRVHLWLRAECKPGEARTGLTPADVRALLASGRFTMTVERSPTRCVADAEYAAIDGVRMVDEHAWERAEADGGAPRDAVVFGLKELRESTAPIAQRHIFFAHAFKNQGGWQQIIGRFKRGGGSILDLEFLTDDSGRRVAAFGRPAGIVGAAAGVLVWCWQQQGRRGAFAPITPWSSEDAMVAHIETQLAAVAAGGARRTPSFMIIGARGRVGQGAVHLLSRLGITATEWDMAETSRGGPFAEVLEHEVMLNTIYLQPNSTSPPFVTTATLNAAGAARRLAVLVDVSCDSSSPWNPVPVYEGGTTFAEPLLRAPGLRDDVPPLDVCAIDHLPSALPLESSVNYAEQLMPSMLGLPDNAAVWQRAAKLYEEKAALVDVDANANADADAGKTATA